MKKILIAVIVIVGLVYLYLVLAVNTKAKEFEEFKEKTELDSINYHTKKADSTKAAQ
jgi:hypothetical protein